MKAEWNVLIRDHPIRFSPLWNVGAKPCWNIGTAAKQMLQTALSEIAVDRCSHKYTHVSTLTHTVHIPHSHVISA